MPTIQTATNFTADIEAISRIEAVPSILEVICRTTGMGFAAVARVTENKWIVCAVKDDIKFGLEPGGELRVETTICHEIQQSHKPVVINHVAMDAYYSTHHTPAMYGFQSYISVPIILKSGEFFGTLCAIDPNPADLDNIKVRNMFTLFAELIAFHLQAMEDLNVSKKSLLEERSTSELREQFIAILGHDLRNPVTATLMGSQMLLLKPLDEESRKFTNIIQNAAYRMKALINNMLDFASGRLGKGIVLDRKPQTNMQQTIEQIVAEFNSIWVNREIKTEFDLPSPVYADSDRIAQLFSNLLSNALTYGKKNEPVIVRASCTPDSFMLSVTNAGEKIPAGVIDRLFQPYYRGDTPGNPRGLGLGLYIASQIALAHEGVLGVNSTDEETCFSLYIPY